MSDVELAPCPWCKSPATNPLLHSNNCYISLMTMVFQGKPEPPAEEVAKAWNSMAGDWVNAPKPLSEFKDLELANGTRLILELEDGALKDCNVGDDLKGRKFKRYALFAE